LIDKDEKIPVFAEFDQEATVIWKDFLDYRNLRRAEKKVSRNEDVAYLRQQAKENITRYVDERLPEEYEKCLVGLNSILKEAWTMSQTDDSIKSDKIRALALAKECYAIIYTSAS
jgi:hypothetical protein